MKSLFQYRRTRAVESAVRHTREGEWSAHRQLLASKPDSPDIPLPVCHPMEQQPGSRCSPPDPGISLLPSIADNEKVPPVAGLFSPFMRGHWRGSFLVEQFITDSRLVPHLLRSAAANQMR